MAYDQTGLEIRAGSRVLLPAIVSQIDATAPPHLQVVMESAFAPDGARLALSVHPGQLLVERPPLAGRPEPVELSSILCRRVETLLGDLEGDLNVNKSGLVEAIRADLQMWASIARELSDGTTTKDATGAKAEEVAAAQAPVAD